jgi:cell wall-associated NlpC family hydrolase
MAHVMMSAVPAIDGTQTVPAGSPLLLWPSAQQWARRSDGHFEIVWTVTYDDQVAAGVIPGGAITKVGLTLPVVSSGSGIRMPQFGDIVITRGNHVGVYIGEGLRVDAWHKPDSKNGSGTGSVRISPVMPNVNNSGTKTETIYRSPTR